MRTKILESTAISKLLKMIEMKESEAQESGVANISQLAVYGEL
jgi:hypothetical protein